MSPLCPKHERTWLARVGRAGGTPTHAVWRQPGCVGRECRPAGVCPQAEHRLWRASSPFHRSVACFSAAQLAQISFTEIGHGMLGGVFLVSPPSLLAGFAALQVSDGVARRDQRSSGGLGLDICAFVYYLLLSLILSKITLTERTRAKHSFPCRVLCTPGLIAGRLELPPPSAPPGAAASPGMWAPNKGCVCPGCSLWMREERVLHITAQISAGLNRALEETRSSPHLSRSGT